MSYTKLHRSLLQSSLWTSEPDHVRLVWITAMALADERGVVEASVPGLAHASCVSLEKCIEALQRLTAPDPYSRCKDEDGRRLVEVEGGWRLVTFEHYRSKRDAVAKREVDRIRQSRRRARLSVTPVTPVTHCHAPSREVAQAEAEAEAVKAETRDPSTPTQSSSSTGYSVPPSTEQDPDKSARARDPRTTGRTPLQLAADQVAVVYVRHMHDHRGIVAPAVARNDRARGPALAALAGDPARLEQACDLVRRYVEEDDPWLREQGWPWRVFPSRMTSLQSSTCHSKIPEVMRG